MFLQRVGLDPTKKQSTTLDNDVGDDRDTAGRPIYSLCSSDMDGDETVTDHRPTAGSTDIGTDDDWTRARIPAREVAEPGDEDGTALYVGGIIGGLMDRGAHVLEWYRQREPRNHAPVHFN